MTPKEILTKTPFKRILPDIAQSNWGGFLTDGTEIQESHSSALYQRITQDDYLREYDPAGHKIWNTTYLCNRIKTNAAGRTYIHFVERNAFPFQAIITTKQLTHLTGNPIRFTNSSPNPTDAQEAIMAELKQGWIKKNMEEIFFKAAKAEKVTGDCAIVGYVSNGKFGARVLSYFNDEILYPQYDNKTGQLSEFGRSYRTYKQDGVKISAEYLDVWDETYLRTYEKTNSFGTKVKTLFGSDGWELVSSTPHGFSFVPVAYKRSYIGACWSLVQDCIDKYELAASSLCENNKAYAFRILFVKGAAEMNFDSSGSPTAIMGGENTDAKILDGSDVSSAFELQLKILLQNIFTGSFTVLPPEVKSGDLPGVAIKLLYSPAVEKAMEEAKEWNGFIDDLLAIFKHGYGIEAKRTSEFESLDVRAEIVPYVHQNIKELVDMLNTSVVSGTMTKESAWEQHPLTKNNEKARMVKQDDYKLEIARKEAEIKADSSGRDAALNETNLQRKLNAE